MGLFEEPELTINASELMHKAGRIVAEWGGKTARRENIENALSLMARGELHIGRWITNQLPEMKAEEAMMMLIEKRGNAIGVEIVH